MDRENVTRKIVLSGVFLAMGLVLPFVTMHIPAIGNMLSPMHIPVLLCGLICGWPYGLAIGMITPILRSILFAMPPLVPNAVAMMFELAVYGLVSGLMMQRPGRGRKRIYLALVTAMVSGRLAWGCAAWAVFTLLGNVFTWTIFFTQAFLNAIPAIIIQLVLIPPLVGAATQYNRDDRHQR